MKSPVPLPLNRIQDVFHSASASAVSGRPYWPGNGIVAANVEAFSSDGGVVHADDRSTYFGLCVGRQVDRLPKFRASLMGQHQQKR